MKSFNKKFGDQFLLEDKIKIVTGNETKNIRKIISPEEFFQRSGVRGINDAKAGQPFYPSGSITVTPDGQIIILPGRWY
ncbi:MBL fold metallo-hydrolase [Acetivibrio mesophilus]|uniref:Uncharacterized protein n=1 Tax=Acetivibrio mesophilus TaxID=2487273 RepID=A0A4Q0I0R3_9FIRM|nr:hypothetical protein [Acetivibrio mesophilus]ODM27839.1 hypothetical protein A7W90_17360 [Clostridium sp. Bc-iso-3]RXE57758.1 hypothetical protein EFD62_16015 [Acetivibrio mesophilus]